MFEKFDSSNRQKWMVAPFSISAKVCGKIWVGFCLTQEKPLEDSF